MLSIYTNVNVMRGEEELASEAARHNDDVLAIAKGLVEQFELKEVTHVELELVLEKDGEILYENKHVVSKLLRVPFTI